MSCQTVQKNRLLLESHRGLKSKNFEEVNMHINSFLARGEDDMEEIRASKPWLEVLEMVVENVRKHQDNG